MGQIFSQLPKEIRRRIYYLAIPKGEWSTADVDSLTSNFPKGIGDLSGFYFPLSSLGVLGVNKEMRQEALPLAYRSTMFRLDDMDDLIKLLIAVGDTGRNNIESLEFAWQSKTDFELQWTEARNPSEHSLTLPVLHVAKCIQLLNQCKNLKFLRLFFDSDLISRNSPEAYKKDPGIHGLCSIRGIERLEIYDLAFEPLDNPLFVRWLQETIQSSHRDQD